MHTHAQNLTYLKKLETGLKNRITLYATSQNFEDAQKLRSTEEDLQLVQELIKREKYMRALGGLEAIVHLAKQASSSKSLFS